MEPINLIAHIPTPEENVGEVLDLLNEYGEHVRTMDGAERFEVYRNRDANEIIVVERYRDESAFAEHMADPANEVLNAKLGELTPGGSQLTFLALS